MKTCIKRFLCLLMALCLMGQWLPAPAQAVPGDSLAMQTDRISHEEITEINPLYANVITEEDLVQPSGRETAAPSAVAESEYDTTEEELVALIRQALLQRQTEFVFYYTTEAVDSSEEFDTTYVKALFRKAMEHTGEPTEGDCLRWGYGGYRTDISYYVSNGLCYVTATPTVTYYTTAAQEAELDIAVEELLSTVDRTASDYEQIKTVYDYICANITYDHEHLKDNSYTLKYTAYAALINGTAVCQGYAVLLYRLALELGIDARLIGGIGNNGSHGWNIVKLNDVYYNLDSTWDAIRMQQVGYYQYFLQCEETFTEGGTDHFRYEEYDTLEFHAAYPMSQTDYDPNAIPEEPDFIAEGVCGDNLTWVLDNEGVLTISGEGEMQNYDSDNNAPWYSYGDAVTSAVIEDGVTTIGDYTFYFCSNMSNVEIPDSVTSIGNWAFYSCESLGSVEIPDSVTAIGNSAFQYCNSLSSVEIPDSVTTIGSSAFYNCRSLSSVVIGESVTTIGRDAFYSCNSLTGIYVDERNQYYSSDSYGVLYNHQKTTLIQAPSAISGSYVIPDSVTTIGDSAFYMCDGLTSVTIPDSVTTIDDSAFGDCDSLTNVTIPDSVTAIGSSAFENCDSLTSITLPERVTSIDMYTFCGCVRLTAITLPEGVTSIGMFAFASCIRLTSITLPEGVDNIGLAAFSNCTRLKEITFIGNAPFIDNSALGNVTATAYYPANNPTWTDDVMQSYGGTITWVAYDPNVVAEGTCGENVTWTLDKDGVLTISGTGDMDSYSSAVHQPWYDLADAITSIRVEGTVNKIGAYSFYGLNNLDSVVIEEGVTSISGHALKYCSSLCSVILPESLTDFGPSVFYGSDLLTTAGPIGGDTHIQFAWTEAIPDGAFNEMFQLSYVVLPGALKSIGAEAFRSCAELTGIDLPDGLETIGVQAFESSGLTKISFPDSVTAIGSEAFEYCPLTEVRLPAALKVISANVFHDCEELLRVTIPGSVEEIELRAFWSCDGLETVIFEGNAPQIQERAFENTTTTAYYPANNPTWTEDVMQDYGGDITWVASYPVIVASGTCGEHLEWVLTEDGTLTISGEGAMEHYDWDTAPWYDYCDSITAAVIEDGVTTIGDFAFCASYSLVSVTFPDSVTAIGNYAFAHCESLTSVMIGANVTSIGECAFPECHTLTGIYVDEANPCYTSDDYGVLYDRQKTTLIQAPGAISGDYVIPDSVTTIGHSAFSYCNNLISVTIGDGVTTIGEYAFCGCDNLSCVTIGSSVTTVGDYAFAHCDILDNVILPEGVTTIGEEAFYDCGSLSSMTIPDSVTSIGYAAFCYCYRLSSVTIPAGVTYIGDRAFECCFGMERICVDENNQNYSSDSYGVLFDKLKTTLIQAPGAISGTYSIPDSVTFIGNSAFACCDGLSSVTIPGSVTYIGEQAFSSCDILSQIKFTGDAPTIEYDNVFMYLIATAYYPIDNPTWTEGVMQDYGGDITWEPYYVSGLDALTVGDVNALEQNTGDGWEFDPATDTLYLWGGGYDGDADAAIYAEGDLTIVLEEGTDSGFHGVINGVLVMGNLTITGGGHLNATASVAYNEGIQYGSAGIAVEGDLTITGAAVTAESDLAGIFCAGKLEIIDSSVTARGSREGICANGDIRISGSTVEAHSTSVQDDYKWDFRGRFLMGLQTRQGILTVENGSHVNAFSDQFGVYGPEIRVQDSTLTSTATLMAVYAETLISVTGESNIHAIATLTPEQYEQYGEQAYAIGSDGQIEIGEGLTFEGEIGNESGQTRQTILGSDGIPAREVHIVPVTKIASGYSGTTTWVLTNDGVMTFSGTGNMKNYGFGRNQPWLDYADQITSIVVEEGVTAIGTGAFMDLTRLESVTLPENSLTKIGEAAFYGCSSLKDIYLPDGIYTIWEYTFKNCTSLASIRLPRTLEKIDQGTFENCTGLETMFLPGNVNIIGAWSFKGCTGLKEVDMQWTDATEIRAGAFKNCTALKKIILPANIQKLGDSCFYGIGATSFTVPTTVTVIEPWCFARAALKEIIFVGNAPTIGEGAFNKITLTAYYPGGNTTWTADNMLNYGGTVTWMADET